MPVTVVVVLGLVDGVIGGYVVCTQKHRTTRTYNNKFRES